MSDVPGGPTPPPPPPPPGTPPGPGGFRPRTLGVIIWAIPQAAIRRGPAQATIGDPVDVEASYRWGLSRFGSVLLVAVLVGIVVGVGFILLIIPGIIFLVFLSVSEPALIVENRRGREGLKRSWNLVRAQ